MIIRFAQASAYLTCKKKLLVLLHIQNELIEIEEDYTNMNNMEEHKIEKKTLFMLEVITEERKES